MRDKIRKWRGKASKPSPAAHPWWWPALVLAVATAILQSHAIPYWVGQAGPWGWLWSPGAELLAWWFLSRTGWPRLVGLLAAAIVVSGPLAQMTLPVITQAQAESRSATALQTRIQALEADIRQAEQRAKAHREQAGELEHYSDGRYQRQVELSQQAEAEARKLRAKRRKLLARRTQTELVGMGWAEWVHLFLHGGILVVAWLGSVTAVTVLSHGGYEGGAAGEGQVPPALQEPDPRVTLKNQLKEVMEQQGWSQSALAKTLGLARPEVGRVLAHERLVSQGERTASRRTWDEVQSFLSKGRC